MLTGMISKPSARPFARGLRRIQESSYAGKSSGSGFRRSRHSGAPEGRTRNLEVMKRDSGFALRAPRNDDYVGIPIRLISQRSSIPEFSLTRARTVSPRVSISCPLALPVLIRKLQCISDTCAPPTRNPRQPAASINFQALLPGGFSVSYTHLRAHETGRNL